MDRKKQGDYRMKEIIQFRKELDKLFPKKFELDIGEGNFVLLVAISSKFEGLDQQKRFKLIEPLIHQFKLTPGIIELYTDEEAKLNGVKIMSEQKSAPTSWEQIVGMLSTGNIHPTKKLKHPVKRVVFYSYKGGVGRTTALIQTAFQLTRAGKRVVLVDMDVEAPGLQSLLPPEDGLIDNGLIDYLWEQQTGFFDDNHKPSIHLVGSNQGKRTGIAYSITDTQSRRPLFVIPAGKIGQRYIQRLSALSVGQLFAQPKDAWYTFEHELWDKLQPDIILIDARTGLNEWGGLSLLRLADEAFVALYPSIQNAEGISFVRSLLKEVTGISSKIILSPVPEGAIGRLLVERIRPYLSLNKDEDIIQIPYHPSVAGNDGFPIETALPYYARIANLLLESSGIEETESALSTPSYRLELIKSLSFPERNAASILDTEFDTIFQKTADFDRCLEDTVWVIRGRKGTGKSTLYTLFTKHRENAEKRSHGRLNNIKIISGHGNSNEFRPTSTIFESIQKELSKNEVDWMSLWRAYAIIQMYRNLPDFRDVIKKVKNPLSQRLDYNFDVEKYEKWESKHTSKLLEFAIESKLNGYCYDAMTQLNSWLKEQNTKLWLLYDDLDQDIKEGSSWQQEALAGLMRLVYDSNNQALYQIRFKIFLREDIWNNLVFTNKSHFGEERTHLLKWDKKDFLRLAYRLAVGGSSKFKHLTDRLLPLAENQLDETEEETLQQALSPLWGLQQKSKNAYVAQWVYSRLTDSSDNTYPRSLTILLNAAKKEEMEQSQKTSPNDHLLRWASLTEGLKQASIERCDAIKNEYPEFSEFFKEIRTLSSLFRKEDLEVLWKKTIEPSLALSLDEFINRLEQIGFLSRKKYNAKYDYAIANLYIDGFGITRQAGQRK